MEHNLNCIFFNVENMCTKSYPSKKKKWITAEKQYALKGRGFQDAKYVK